MSKTVLSLDAVTKRFGGQLALDGVSIAIEPTEVHALVGHNGSGKSTLAWLLAGRYSDYGGRIRIQGREVQLRTRRESLANHIQLVPQEPLLVPEMTVAENLAIGNTSASILRKSKSHRKMLDEARDTLALYGVRIDPSVKAVSLDIESRQVVDLVKTVERAPLLLILDEPPLTNLNVSCVLERVIEVMRQRCSAVLIISHRLAETKAIADRISVLSEGRIATSMYLEHTPQRTTGGLLASSIASSLGTRSKRMPISNCTPCLKCEFGPNDGSFSASESLLPGRVQGILSTPTSAISDAIRAMLGIVGQIPWKLQIFIRVSEEVIKLGPALGRGDLHYVSNDRVEEGIFPDLTAAENVTLFGSRILSSFGIVSKHRQLEAAKHLLTASQFDLTRLHEKAEAFSGGNQQKLMIARAGMTNARVIIFDEPNRGVDSQSIPHIISQIRELRKQGRWVIVLSGDTEFLSRVSDEVFHFDFQYRTA